MKKYGKEMGKNIIEVKQLKKYFPIRKRFLSKAEIYVKAIDDINFSIKSGETFGLVGESGCGKTTTGRVILKLIKPTSGKIFFEGRDLETIVGSEMRSLRREMQIIFQDPYSSLDPRMKVLDLVGEGLTVNNLASGKARTEIVIDSLEKVGLDADYAYRYPHQFSGGQRQRIGIARALAVKPKVIVCDEPVSALDVSIQAQIINLLEDLQNEYGLTYLFIAHDLSVVRHISRKIAVMYLGKIAELASREIIYDNPLHPYTRALISAVPSPSVPVIKKRIILEGDVPSPINPPKGCRFHERCQYRKNECDKEDPEFKEIEPNHFIACHMY